MLAFQAGDAGFNSRTGYLRPVSETGHHATLRTSYSGFESWAGYLSAITVSERGEVWSSRLAGGREIAGSNPVVPTEADHIRVWGNLGTRVVWDHEIVGSNPIARTSSQKYAARSFNG